MARPSSFLGAGATASEDVVYGDGACAEKDEREGKGGQRQRELDTVIPGEAVVPMHFPDGHDHVDADGESGEAGEESGQDEQSAKEFGEGGQVGGPCGESQAGDELGVMMESAKDFVIAMDDHNGPQGQTHEQQSERLQTIKVAHEVPPGENERNIDYSNPGATEKMKPPRAVPHWPLSDARKIPFVFLLVFARGFGITGQAFARLKSGYA